MGCLDFLLSIAAKLSITEIISVDINNIWPVRTKWNTALKDAYTGQNRRYSVDFIHKWLFFAGENNLLKRIVTGQTVKLRLNGNFIQPISVKTVYFAQIR